MRAGGATHRQHNIDPVAELYQEMQFIEPESKLLVDIIKLPMLMTSESKSMISVL